uniref:C2H2-type domain-containing protein n=1 Tax=Leptobrachium leishanense TaxID=445787 RepID=A0A8C5PRP4_9ANUR
MNKDKARDPLSQKILDLTLEIIFLLTGEDHLVVKIHEMVTDHSTHQISEGGYCRTQSFNTEPPPHSGIHEQNNEKILELTNKINQLLTGEVPIRCEDVSVYLSMEEWEYLEGHRDLYEDATRENHRPVMALDKSVSGESHTPVSLSDSRNKSITNNVEQHLKKQTKGRAESATNTDQESLASGEEQVPNKTNYSTIKCTEYSPTDIKQEPASCEEENLTYDVLNKTTENILANYSSYKGSDSHKRGDIADPDIYFPPEDTQTEYPFIDKKKESPIYEESNRTNTDVFRPTEHTQAAYTPHNIGESLTGNTNLMEIHNNESLIESIKPGLSTNSTNLTHSSGYKGNSASSDTEKAAYSTSDLVIHEINCRDDETFSHTFFEKKSTDSSLIYQPLQTEEQPFSCSECEKHFTNKIALKKHQRIHTTKKTFKCPECGKCFTFFSQLARHKIIHSGEKAFNCTECENCFTSSSSLARHKIIHSGEKPFNCTECENCFTSSSSLARHKRIHTGVKPFKCPECGKCFKQTSHLATHIMIHTGVKPFNCTECENCFTSSSSLARHKIIHSGEKTFNCTECENCFTSSSSLARHKRIHTGVKPFKCPECGKCFNQASHLAAHKRFHTGEKPFKCSECGKGISDARSLARHKMIHTGVKPFKCTECGKCFNRANNFATHKMIHTGEKPFKCSECGKGFIEARSLATHKMIHTGEIPFKCPECGKGFSEARSLETHKMIHTGEKPFKCPECGKGFSEARSLVTHKMSHTGEKPFKCPECGKGFSDARSLARHKMIHTGVK